MSIDLQPETAMLQMVEPCPFPTGNPGVGIGVMRFAGAYVVVQRRAIEVIGNGLPQSLAAMFLPTADAAAAFVQLPLAASRADKPVIRLLAYRGGFKRRR